MMQPQLWSLCDALPWSHPTIEQYGFWRTFLHQIIKIFTWRAWQKYGGTCILGNRVIRLIPLHRLSRLGHKAGAALPVLLDLIARTHSTSQYCKMVAISYLEPGIDISGQIGNLRHLLLPSVPALKSPSQTEATCVCGFRRKSSSSAFTCSAWVQFKPCGPPGTTARRLFLTISCVLDAVAPIGVIRSESP